MDISIIVPAFNEEKRITPTLETLGRFLQGRYATGEYEILVVDDGSQDGTVKLVRELAKRIPGLSCLPQEQNRGKGAAVRVGMLATSGRLRVMYDADGSIPVTELPKLLDAVESKVCDIAIGSRYAEGAAVQVAQPMWRVLWSRLVNQVVRKSLVPGILDTQCGCKVFSAQASDFLFVQAQTAGWSFDLEVLALALRQGFTVKEMAVAWTDDRRSRVNPLKDFAKVIKEWLRIRKHLKSAPPRRKPALSGSLTALRTTRPLMVTR